MFENCGQKKTTKTFSEIFLSLLYRHKIIDVKHRTKKTKIFSGRFRCLFYHHFL